jgi:DNA-binding NtrC family response regulator
MLRRWDVLVACTDLTKRSALVHMLEGLSVNVFSCSTLNQTGELLSRQKIELVFCDESLSDGSFRDLLRASHAWMGKPRIVVLFSIGEWAEYLEALQLGVFEVISTPVHPTDVELAVIRAIRDAGQGTFHQMIA